MSYYQAIIRFALAQTRWCDAEPRLVEAAMRLECGGTLDHLSAREFDARARDAAQFVTMHPETAAALADTY